MKLGGGCEKELVEIIVGDLWLFPMKNVNHGYIMALFPSHFAFFYFSLHALLFKNFLCFTASRCVCLVSMRWKKLFCCTFLGKFIIHPLPLIWHSNFSWTFINNIRTLLKYNFLRFSVSASNSSLSLLCIGWSYLDFIFCWRIWSIHKICGKLRKQKDLF